MAADFKIAQPLEYYRQFIKENIRTDGRELNEFRKLIFRMGSIKTADGSAMVRLGETMIVCGIKSELAEPSAKDEDKGFFIPNVELPPSCSSDILPGPPTEKAQVLSQQVLEYVKNSGIIDLKELCIIPKKLCWVVYADIVCISHDGNLLDAVLTSLLGALHDTKLPVITVDKETEEIKASNSDTFKLNLHNDAVSTTVSLFDDKLLCDPTKEEEELCNGSITVISGNGGQLVSLYKPGGIPVSEDVLRSCMQLALNRHKEVLDHLSSTCEEVGR